MKKTKQFELFQKEQFRAYICAPTNISDAHSQTNRNISRIYKS